MDIEAQVKAWLEGGAQQHLWLRLHDMGEDWTVELLLQKFHNPVHYRANPKIVWDIDDEHSGPSFSEYIVNDDPYEAVRTAKAWLIAELRRRAQIWLNTADLLSG